MRLRCDSIQLAAALGIVARAIPARTALPVLGTVLLETTDDHLVLTATNLELGIRREVAADVDEEGAVAVPGRLLADFAAALPAETMALEADPAEHRLRLRSDSFQTDIHGISPDEFPPAPRAESGVCLALPAAQLVAAIADALPAASTDEARPVLTGVHLAVEGRTLLLVTTDGHRLAVRRVDLGPGATAAPLSVTVPARTLAEVVRLFRAVDADIRLSVSPPGNQVFIRGPGLEVSSRVIDGSFPDHRRLVPDRATTVVTVSAADLLHRVRAIAPFAQSSANVVRLGVTGGALTLAAAATDVGSARTDLEAHVRGPELTVAFNARFLLDCPALTTDERVELHLHGPLGPIIVRRANDDGYLYLFMPVRHVI